jgi:HK97 family phage prohead protease
MALAILKSFEQSVKDVDTVQGIVSGYFSKFGNKDSDGDIIQKGAYTKTIQENFRRIKHLLDHDRTKAVGVIQELKEDEYGLFYVSKAGRHTLGQDFLKMAEDGIITEHSVTIIPIKQKQSEELKANIITEVKMMEGSSLQFWGANEMTPIVGVKSESDLFDLMNVLEKALRNGTYSDDTFKEIEKRYKGLKDIFTSADFVTNAEIEKNLLSNFLFNKN